MRVSRHRARQSDIRAFFSQMTEKDEKEQAMSKYADLYESMFDTFMSTGIEPTRVQLDELYEAGLSESADFVNNLVDEVTAHLGHGDNERELMESLAPRLADAGLPVDLVTLVAIFALAKSKNLTAGLEPVA